MISIPAKAHVQPDGTLSLQVSTNLPESDVEVLVVVNPAIPSAWPPSYFEQTFGCTASEPLSRPR